MAIKTQQSQKCETPFKVPTWKFNEIPACGIPTRQRAQSVVSSDECKTGIELVAEYRRQEVISHDNDIESRTTELEKPFGGRGIPGELLRREIALCDHDKFLKAQERLAELRAAAFTLVEPIFRRLVQSYGNDLNEEALVSEQRLDKSGLPIRSGNEWLLHSDSVCRALWSCRHVTEKTRAALLEHRDGVGATQYLCTSEEGVPFQWVA
jgi:hypothetical protein